MAVVECKYLPSWLGMALSWGNRFSSYFSSMVILNSIFLMILQMSESVSLSFYISLTFDSSFFNLTSIFELIYNIKMNLFLNRALRTCFRSYKLITPKTFYAFSIQPGEFELLKELFTQHQDVIIFNELIEKSNNTIDNINYFRIFKALEENQSPIKHYEDFFQLVNSTVVKKSDNVRMLLAKVKARIAKKHEQNKNYYDTLSQIEQGLEVLEQSLVPPVLLYYQLYRYYGHIQNIVGNKKEALQALSESVDMIERYLEHSDDQVASNQNSKNQAKAYNALVSLDPANADKWLAKANQSWEQYEGNKFDLAEYADTVVHNARKQYKISKQKGEGFLMFNLYQFKNEDLKAKLTLAKNEFES